MDSNKIINACTRLNINIQEFFLANNLVLRHYFPEFKKEIDELLMKGIDKENFKYAENVFERLKAMKEKGLEGSLQNK